MRPPLADKDHSRGEPGDKAGDNPLSCLLLRRLTLGWSSGPPRGSPSAISSSPSRIASSVRGSGGPALALAARGDLCCTALRSAVLLPLPRGCPGEEVRRRSDEAACVEPGLGVERQPLGHDPMVWKVVSLTEPFPVPRMATTRVPSLSCEDNPSPSSEVGCCLAAEPHWRRCPARAAPPPPQPGVDLPPNPEGRGLRAPVSLPLKVLCGEDRGSAAPWDRRCSFRTWALSCSFSRAKVSSRSNRACCLLNFWSNAFRSPTFASMASILRRMPHSSTTNVWDDPVFEARDPWTCRGSTFGVKTADCGLWLPAPTASDGDLCSIGGGCCCTGVPDPNVVLDCLLELMGIPPAASAELGTERGDMTLARSAPAASPGEGDGRGDVPRVPPPTPCCMTSCACPESVLCETPLPGCPLLCGGEPRGETCAPGDSTGRGESCWPPETTESPAAVATATATMGAPGEGAGGLADVHRTTVLHEAGQGPGCFGVAHCGRAAAALDAARVRAVRDKWSSLSPAPETTTLDLEPPNGSAAPPIAGAV